MKKFPKNHCEKLIYNLFIIFNLKKFSKIIVKNSFSFKANTSPIGFQKKFLEIPQTFNEKIP